MLTFDQGLFIGQSGHLALSVAMTAMVWSAATCNVGLDGCGVQRDRTGSFDRVKPSGLSLRTSHTEHRSFGSQSSQ